MTSARLYCQASCAACKGLARSLSEGGVAVEVHDVTAEPDALEQVEALGYRSLPVLVGPDGSSSAGAAAIELTSRLIGRAGSADSHVRTALVEEEE